MTRSDKRVYDIHAQLHENARWLVLAISGDATLAELHLALLGAFEWRGRYTEIEQRYRFTIDDHRFEDGRGSRTALRKLLTASTRFTYDCDPAAIALDCAVVRQYEVPSRRHHPKVVEACAEIWTQGATWQAQIAARHEYREHERYDRRR